MSLAAVPSATLRRLFSLCVLPLCLVALVPGAAQAGGPQAGARPAPTDARGWLARIHAAASTRNYQGTMVVSAAGVMSSSRVAHFCVGDQVFERIEALDGKQRQVYRHNDTVHTVWPQSRLAVVEKRGAQTRLPSATQSIDPRALEQYELRSEGQDRIADREATVFLLQPRDALRFAQRLWVDDETGLMLRSDIIDAQRGVLETSAFSQVQIGIKPQPETVLKPIRKMESLRVLRPTHVPTQLEAVGWTVTREVPGFPLVSCVKRVADVQAPADVPAARAEVVQAVFSDGLTHVSVFIEPFDPARHRAEMRAQFGATHSLAGRRGDAWLTVMGDVPPATLKQLADALERRP